MHKHESHGGARTPTTAWRLVAALLWATALGCAREVPDEPLAPPDAERAEPDDQALYYSPSITWPGGVVPVCFPGRVPDARWPRLIRWILEDTWSVAANIRFTGFDACANHQGKYVEVTFVSGQPPDPDGPRTKVQLPFAEVTRNIDGVDQSITRATIIHEFGHALGFLHELQRPDFVAQGSGGSDPTCPTRATAARPTQGGRYLTPIDRQSIMSSCTRLENLSGYDRTGALAAYGNPVWQRSAARSLLWHASDGRLAVWLFTSTGAIVEVNPQPRSPMLNGRVVATGDFNGDGLGDVVWRSTEGTATSIWTMNSGSIETVFAPPDPGAAWAIAGSGDFDGDGRSELLWQSRNGDLSVWSPTWQRALGQLAGWVLASVGDYDGDRRSDLLLRGANGDVLFWPIGTALQSSVVQRGLLANWSIAGSGDFDGNGQSDVLLVGSEGDLAVWFGAVSQARSLGRLSAGWGVAAIGDFDADGASDVLLRNAAGQTSISLRAGLTGQFVDIAGMTANWSVAGSLLDRVF